MYQVVTLSHAGGLFQLIWFQGVAAWRRSVEG